MIWIPEFRGDDLGLFLYFRGDSGKFLGDARAEPKASGLGGMLDLGEAAPFEEFFAEERGRPLLLMDSGVIFGRRLEADDWEASSVSRCSGSRTGLEVSSFAR